LGARALQECAIRWPGHNAQPNQTTEQNSPAPANSPQSNPFNRSQLHPALPCPHPDLLKKPLTTAALAKGVTVRLAFLTPCDIHSTSDDTYIPTKPAFVVTLFSPDGFPCPVHSAHRTLPWSLSLKASAHSTSLACLCFLFSVVSCCVVRYKASHKTTLL